MTSVVVAGAIANKPWNGGEAWVRLSWLETFRRLGFSTYFVEQISERHCVDASGRAVRPGQSTNVAYFDHVMSQFGHSNASSLVLDKGSWTRGASFEELESALDGAVLINISGNLRRSDLLRRCATSVYVDIDPGYTQLWAERGLLAGLADHDIHFTIGENIGTCRCPLPTAGYRWRPVRQPVVLDQWPVLPGHFDRFTTVARWRAASGPVAQDGRTYGLKLHEFRRLVEAPSRTGLAFELALEIDPADAADLELLTAHRWRVVDPQRVAGDPGAFRAYVQRSGAEFSVAQGVYVDTASGWFSDRTVRYLASGRPAVVQDTGWAADVSPDAGLLTFRTMDDAVDAARRVVADYEIQGRAARDLAAAHFSHDVVAPMLLTPLGIDVPRRPRQTITGP